MKQVKQILNLIFGEDTVTYLDETYPSGMIACKAMRISPDVLASIQPLCRKIEPVNTLIRTQTTEKSILLAAGKAAHELFTILGQYEPFTYMADPLCFERLDQMFTVEACKKISTFCKTVNAGKMDKAAMEHFSATTDLTALAPAFANLYDALSLLQEKLGAFADLLDQDDSIRTKEAYLNTFGEYFPADAVPGDGTDSWLSMSNTTVQYVAGKPDGEDDLQMLRHMHFISYGGMFRSDFFEGLAAGHAPKRCANCGRWFLTTDARHTKYCGEICPGDEKGRTCRQIAALKGRESRELADDNPTKELYKTRMNTIDHGMRRGNLDPDLGDEMKFLARCKEERALSDADYANGAYASEMEQKALKDEALALLNHRREA